MNRPLDSGLCRNDGECEFPPIILFNKEGVVKRRGGVASPS